MIFAAIYVVGVLFSVGFMSTSDDVSEVAEVFICLVWPLALPLFVGAYVGVKFWEAVK